MVTERRYVPDRGDIVWLDFTPQAGHEQRGRRPALVISPKEYNKKVRLGLFCPITSRIKGYPFEVEIDGKTTSGCVLSDQVKSLDWSVRSIEFIEKIGKNELDDVITNIILLLRK